MTRWAGLALVVGALVAAGCQSGTTTSSTTGTQPSIATTPATTPIALLDHDGQPLVLGAAETTAVAAMLGVADGPVRTTLDAEVQAAVDRAVAVVPGTGGRFEQTVVVADTATGAVRGLHVPAATAATALTDRRPSGSTLKAVLLAAAAEAGVSGQDVIDGAASCVFPVAEPVPYDAAFGTDVRPLAPLTDMTAHSVNCAFARLYLALGPDRVEATARRLGLGGSLARTPRFATGATAVSPMELAGAMQILLNGGVAAPLHLTGEVATEARIDAAAAAETAAILRAPVEAGTAIRARLYDGRPVAAKTGTQPLTTDAWIAGGTPQLVVAVWMGNPADPSDPMVNVPELRPVTEVNGGTYPAMVFKTVLDEALAGQPIVDIPVPAATRPPVQLLAPGLDCTTAPTTELAPGLVVTDPGASVVPCGG